MSDSDRHPDQAVDRRRFVTAVGAGAVVGLAGCAGQGDGGGDGQDTDGGDGSDGSDGSDTQESHIRATSPITYTLDPVMKNPVTPWYSVLELTYDTLTWIDTDMQVHPNLAVDWESNDSLDEWTFTLRDDATFNHNGEQVTASDVKATFDTIYDPDVGSPSAGTIGPLANVQAPDDTTVVLDLETPTPDLPTFMSKKNGSVIPQDVLEDDMDALASNTFGSGPFVLENYRVDDRTELVAADDYHLTDSDDNQLPYVDKVTLLTVPDETTEVSMIRNGESEYIPQLAVSQLEAVDNDSGVDALAVPTGTWFGVNLDVTVPPFDDVRIRQAFALALDRNEFVENVTGGYGTVGQDSPLSPFYQYYNQLPERERDIEQAEALLADAGYPDGFSLPDDFGVNLQSAGEPEQRINTALLVNEHLKDIGVDAGFEQVSYDRYVSDVWRKAPMYGVYYNGRLTEDGFLSLLVHSDGNWNDETNWSSPEADEHIEMARSTTDPEVRAEHYAEVQRLIYENVPWLIPAYRNRNGAKATSVTDLPFAGSVFDQYLWRAKMQ